MDNADSEIFISGRNYPAATFSMDPGLLSTIEGTAGPTKAFDFADLPCPPSDVANGDRWFYNPESNPDRPYEPRIVPPAAIYTLDPAFKTCTFPYVSFGVFPFPFRTIL